MREHDEIADANDHGPAPMADQNTPLVEDEHDPLDATDAPPPQVAAPLVAQSRPERVGRPWLPRLTPYLPLIAILAVGALLRIYGYNWDEGSTLHPDERAIGSAVGGLDLPHSWTQFWSPASPLNPHFFAYGSLPFYAMRAFGHFLSFWGHLLGGPFSGLVNADSTYSGTIESGRVVSGLADTGTLLLFYLIGRRVFGHAVGLLAALLGCFTVLNLENAHFAASDTFVTFFVAGALFGCVRIVQEGRPRDYAWAGAWIGLALASKFSAAPLVLPLVVAHLYRGAERPWGAVVTSGDAGGRRGALWANPLLLLMALAVAGGAFFVAMPYAIIDFSNWWAQVWDQLQLARGVTEQAFTRKFAGLPAYYYPLQQLLTWTMGPPLGLAAVTGVIMAVVRQVRRRRGAELVLLTWSAVFVGTTGGQYMKFLRYMVPLTPTLILFAAAALVAGWRWAAARRGARPAAGMAARVAVGAVVALTVLYGLAYENIYTTENTRVAATRWMATHIPTGSAITVEDWDETLPVGVPNVTFPPNAFASSTLAILGPSDGPTTVSMYVQALRTAQYITISSARVFGSVAHQPGRYPYSIRWYQLLFGGKLNFTLQRAFANHPHLGPFVINDYQAVPRADQYTSPHLWYEADQNLSEYDHPPVYIFKRTGDIDPQKATALLTDNGTLHPAVVAYDPTHPMLLSPTVEKAGRAAPAYSAVFPPGSIVERFSLLAWLLMIEVLGLLALPLVMRACGGLRDGGYGLTKVCGIVMVGYLTWLAASVHLAIYSRGTILVACLLTLALSLALGLRPRALAAELRARWRPIVVVEAVFLAGFLVMAAIRAAYPDLWHTTYGGERTQEMSFINGILRSQYFPPLDPWFAGGTLNYYYYGQYLMGMLMKLIGLSSPIGFNLALPTLFGLLLAVAYSIGYNATGRRWVGLVAALLEGVAGNLGTLQQFATINPAKTQASLLPVVTGLRDAIGGIVAVVTHQIALPGDFFWTSSRILSTPNDGVINEFPIWSFTYGDMHAHVIDMPILLCVVGLALAASGMGGGPRHKAPRTWREMVALGVLLAVVAGATGPTNLWDLPTAVALAVIGFGLHGLFIAGRRGWSLVLRDLALPGALLGGACLVLYRPFYASVLGISSGFTFLWPHVDPTSYLLHLGLPLFLLTSFIVAFLWRHTRPLYWLERQSTVNTFSAYYADQADRLPRLFRLSSAMIRQARPEAAAPSGLTLHVVLFGALAALALWYLGCLTLALVTGLVTLAAAALIEACTRRQLDRRHSQPFTLALAVVGLTLTGIPDFITQNEATRMNTFFKLYNQAWPLLALSAALALSALVRPRRAPARATARYRRRTLLGQQAGGGVALATLRRLLPQRLSLADAAPGGGALSWAASAQVGDDERVAPVEPRPWPAPEQPFGATVMAPVYSEEGQPEAAVAQVGPPPRVRRPALSGAGLWEWRVAWWAVLAMLAFGAVLFPIFGVYSHLQLRHWDGPVWSQAAAARVPFGFDGSSFVRVLYPGDAAAIDWINGHITGTPVLLTSPRGGYRDFAAKVTMFTGLPTVSSWDWETSQERYSGQGRPGSMFPPVWVNQMAGGVVTWNGSQWVTNLPTANQPALSTRKQDAETIYSTPDPTAALALLRHYHVGYIYVGSAETGDPNSDESGNVGYFNKAGFDPAGLAKFDRMAASSQLQTVYDQSGVKIYRVV